MVKVSATDSVTVKNWFTDSKSWVDSFSFADGRYLTGTDITRSALTVHGTAGDDVLTGDAVFDNVLYGEAGNDTLNGGSGADALHGGAGNDLLNGDSGNDEYFFERGGGRDLIYDWSGSDMVRFDATITAADLSMSRSGNDLVLSLAGTNDALTIQGYFNGSLYLFTYAGSNLVQYSNRDMIETFAFSDGSSLPTTSSILDTFMNIHGTSSNDVLSGTNSANVIYGGDGNDNLYGIGSDDVLYGDAGDDYLEAGSGSLLYGGEGDDVLVGGVASYMQGGMGNDTYYAAGGSVLETGGSDDKLVFYAGTRQTDLSFQKWDTYNLSIYSGSAGYIDIYNQFLNGACAVERLVFADGSTLGLRDIQFGTGNPLTGTGEDSILVGYGTNDTLNGGGGNDWLDGGLGNDAMTGGVGDDVYFVDNTKDAVTELANEGTDTVSASIAYTLGSNVENLVLSGTAGINGTGNTLNNTITGNSASNTLTGGAGNDWLDGKGGVDKMVGGAGDDTYVVDASGETVTERSGEGTDVVLSSATYTLANNVENLTLTGAAAINGAGNALNNVLTGNAAANLLDGGAGVDRMIGGAGDDTYVIDNALDVVTEGINQGIDLIQTSIAITLADNVENLLLTGTKAVNGTGNALDNVLTGGAGNDRLDGKGGADKMLGGTGDDTYVVDVSTDVITEYANEGIDTVETGVSYTLGAYLDSLTLTGTAAINGTGNTLDNVLRGNSAINGLSGAAGNDILDGGAGADTLTGGAGSDTYILGRGYGADTVVENDATAGNTDIAQFLSGVATDQIWFQHVGNNLEVSIIGTSDKATISNWYLAACRT